MKIHTMFATVLIVAVGLMLVGCGGPKTPDPSSEEVVELVLQLTAEILGTEESPFHTYTQVGPILETSVDEETRSVTFETKVRELDESPATKERFSHRYFKKPDFEGVEWGASTYYLDCKAQRNRQGELIVQVEIVGRETALDQYPMLQSLLE